MERTEQQLLELWKGVFGAFGGFWEAFFRCAYTRDHCLFLEEEGRIQAALYWFDCDCHGPWAYIFAVATAPECRGKGLCRRLMERTHAHLKARGCHGAMLVPAEEGLRRMYEKLGYREGTALGEFALPDLQKLRPLTAKEYAAARPRLLPPGGVIQEGGILTLLEETGARFYAGADSLLAAEGERVLECLNGTAPKKTKPFAMVCPFREDVQIPTYFAFALDE